VDEDLRELERALAASDEPEARFRYAAALARAGRAPEAIQLLAPLIAGAGLAAERARIQAAAIYLAERDEKSAVSLLYTGEFSDDARREYPLVQEALEALLGVPELWGYVARAIGKVAPMDDVVRLFRSVPSARTGRFSARMLFAQEIQKRDKERAKELAKSEPDPAVARFLRSEGTLV
jgi:hypothetical protein